MACARSLTHEESDALLAALPTLRDRLFFLMGFHTGLRISELLSLKVHQVAMGLNPKLEIVIEMSSLKGGKSAARRKVRGRAIPMHPSLGSEIRNYLSDFPGGFPSPGAFLFPSRKGDNMPIGRKHAWRIVKAGARVAGLDDARISTHTMRKSFAAAIYEASGHDILATKELLGHSHIDTTIKYLDPDRERMRGLVTGLAARTPAAAAQTEPAKGFALVTA
jgi:integrase